MKKLVLSLLLCLEVFGLWAQQVDTVAVFSRSMQAEVKNVVILPDNYDGYAELPVLYLLHGYTGNHRTWLAIQPQLPELATRYGMIIVCPDGRNAWYWDSPVNPHMKYETFVAEELVAYIDSHYKTRPYPSGRAITGFSMGGHGGLWLGIRHQDTFGACGATSGGVDIRPFPDHWELKNALGTYAENSRRWDDYTVINLLPQIKSELAILFDCGTEDFFYPVNARLHEEMLYRHIPHEFLSRPGKHDNAYWRRSIGYQLLFFSDFFQGKNNYREHLDY